MRDDENFDPRSEQAKKLNEFPYFTAKPLREIDNRPASNSYDIGVFQHEADGTEIQIGTYQRNDDLRRTFWWFRRGNRHFALYSRDYTATRVMEIVPAEGIHDIGGEESDDGGFCPVEFYVPDCREYVSQEFSGLGEHVSDWENPLSSLPSGCEFTKEHGTHRGTPRLRGPDGQYLRSERGGWIWGEQGDYESGWIKMPPNHGFVFGCIWACPYQVQYLDLSRVEEGIIRREERFGYIDLPRSVLLRDAIYLDKLLDRPRVFIAVSTEWDLQSGKIVGMPPWKDERL
jgi:hypothetical protein